MIRLHVITHFQWKRLRSLENLPRSMTGKGQPVNQTLLSPETEYYLNETFVN